MYEAKYPEVDDVVMVQVKSIAEMGAYVALLEYNGIEGMILLSELSRRRIRSITKLIKVSCNCAAATLRCQQSFPGSNSLMKSKLRLPRKLYQEAYQTIGCQNVPPGQLLVAAESMRHRFHSSSTSGWAARTSHGAPGGQGEGLH